jgi:hypothetical protein
MFAVIRAIAQFRTAQAGRSAFDRTFLSTRTISKIVGREVGFDRRTLKQFFDAFISGSDK